MGDQVRLQTVPIRLHLTEQYFIGRMLMPRERLTRAQWAVFAGTADTIWGDAIERAETYAKPFGIHASQPLAAPEFVSRGTERAPEPPHKLVQ